MSNIEKIKAEIERLKAENRNIRCQHNENYCIGYDDAFSDLLAVINSLPEEKPTEDLEDEIKKFIEEYGYERGEDKLLIAIVARHFTEWQKERMMDEWLKDRDGCFWDGVEEGKKAMEEQMMKDAKEIITVQGSLMEPEFVKQRVIFLKEG